MSLCVKIKLGSYFRRIRRDEKMLKYESFVELVNELGFIDVYKRQHQTVSKSILKARKKLQKNFGI